MAELLKNFYDETFIKRISGNIKQHYPSFNEKRFSGKIFDEQWQDRELKARMRHITMTLKDFLPKNFRDALTILKSISEKSSGFEYMFLPDFVEIYGLDDLEVSIPALEYFTRHSSSESKVGLAGSAELPTLDRWGLRCQIARFRAPAQAPKCRYRAVSTVLRRRDYRVASAGSKSCDFAGFRPSGHWLPGGPSTLWLRRAGDIAGRGTMG